MTILQIYAYDDHLWSQQSEEMGQFLKKNMNYEIEESNWKNKSKAGYHKSFSNKVIPYTLVE